MAQIKWKTKKEIEDEKLLESLMPTKEEIKNAELEINVINLLQEFGGNIVDNLTLVQKRLVNAYAVLVLAGREPNIPEELQEYVNIRVAEIEIEKLG